MPKKNIQGGKIRVSYIMATRNRAKYLKKTLENIREFITKHDELIIMDGASTDDTGKVIAKNLDIINYSESEKDFGEAHALNKGILCSQGKFIKVLTDDDYIYPEAIKFAISVLEKNPDIDALQCGGEAYTYDEKTKKEEILFYEQVSPDVKIANDLVHITTYCPCGLGLILTRRIVARAGLFDSTFRAVDLSYISKLIECKANFKYLNVSLYKHINYSHSGENFENDIHIDEARVYFAHHMWEKVMSVDTITLLPVFGLDRVEKGTELLRSIKLLDFLRRKKIYFPIDLLNLLSKQRKKVIKINEFFNPAKETAPPPGYKPLPPLRDKKFW